MIDLPDEIKKIYNDSGKTTELENEAHNGWHYKILSLNGSHPCCYIEIPKGHPWFRKSCDNIEHSFYKFDERFGVHGGVTFAGHMESRKDWWIGWDYCHYYDYQYISLFDRPPMDWERVWTLDELKEEVFSAIDQLNEIFKEGEDNGT